MRNLFIFLALLVHFITTAQTLSEEKIKQIDSLFAEWDTKNSPGCILGVIQDGKFVYQRGYGIANLEHGIDISPNTVFDIGSTSKQFTAAAIILLQQQGKLLLDDSVRKYIPELPWYEKTITIRHLLNHTSGLRDYNSLLMLAGKQEEQVTTKEDALNIITRQQKLNFLPGDEWDYSNTGFFLASIIVERVSGLSMKEYSEKNIFGPLGMKNTFFLDDHTSIVPYRATAYAPSENGGFQIYMSNWEQTGDGAVQTNCNDLLKWDANFYDPKVGGQDLIKNLTTCGTLSNGKALNYGLGLFKDNFEGIELFHHGGAWAGYRAEFIRAPTEKFSVICLSNLASFDPSSLTQEVAKICLSHKLKPKSVPTASKKIKSKKVLDKATFESFQGHYKSDNNELLREVIAKADTLYYVRNEMSKSPLLYQGGDSFIIKDNNFPLTFSRGKDGKISSITILAGGVKPTLLSRYEPASYSKDAFADAAGKYTSEELQISYMIQPGYSSLILTDANQTSFLMTPVTHNSFIDPSQSIFIDFIRGKNNHIDGFYITVSRVRKILFKKAE